MKGGKHAQSRTELELGDDAEVTPGVAAALAPGVGSQWIGTALFRWPYRRGALARHGAEQVEKDCWCF